MRPLDEARDVGQRGAGVHARHKLHGAGRQRLVHAPQLRAQRGKGIVRNIRARVAQLGLCKASAGEPGRSRGAAATHQQRAFAHVGRPHESHVRNHLQLQQKRHESPCCARFAVVALGAQLVVTQRRVAAAAPASASNHQAGAVARQVREQPQCRPEVAPRAATSLLGQRLPLCATRLRGESFLAPKLAEGVLLFVALGAHVCAGGGTLRRAPRAAPRDKAHT